MPYEKRHYRKKLTSHGLIYLDGVELPMTLSNISITGLLAELNDHERINDVEDLFKTVKISPIVDIYLQEMRLAGEAEIVRADMIDGRIYLALDFRNVEHDVENLFYARHAYRKKLEAPGLIILNGHNYHFNTINVSVDGLMVTLPERIDVEPGAIAAFNFKRLDLLGEVKVVWVTYQDGNTLLGLEYNYLEKTFVEGIPRFSPHNPGVVKG
ncbi:PilZ domain-containing protein [Methylotuvimicrobium sp. KM1]|uniref:PilZ domain-containing protein n=1 Tax=Methylotuvimicrobium sp. KM1 TaxID=3377707 RepID=UPI003850A199